MADLAEFGLGINTTGIKAGIKELDKLGNQAEKTEKVFDKFGNELKETDKELGRVIDSSGRMREKNGRLVKGLEKTNKTLTQTTLKTKQLTAATHGTGAAFLSAAAALTTYISVAKGVDTIVKFEDALLGLQAVTRASVDDMAALEEQARALGATSVFSAEQTANAQKFLAQAGFDTSQILASTAATLDLASAGSLGLAEAADIASNVLGGMGLEVDQLGRVTDVMAEAAAASNTDIQQLGEALKTAAPLAATAGVSIEEATAAIGKLSDAGLQGSRAGTGLLGVIRQLSNVTAGGESALASYGLSIEDVNIEMFGLANVLSKLEDANISTADSFAIFGSEAAPAALILADASSEVETLTGRLENSQGAARDMAGILGSGLSGAFKSLNSQISESVLQLGESGLGTSLQNVTEGVTGVLAVYNDMTDEFAEANDLTAGQVENLEDLAGAVKAVSIVALSAATAYGTYTVAVRAASIATAAFNRIAMANPLGLAITAAGALAGIMIAFADDTQSAADAMGMLADNTDRFNDEQREASRLTLLEEARKLESDILDLREEQARNVDPATENLPAHMQMLHGINDEWSGVNGKLTVAEQKLAKINEELSKLKAPELSVAIKDVTDDFNAMLERMKIAPTQLEVEVEVEDVAARVKEPLTDFQRSLSDTVGEGIAEGIETADYSALGGNIAGVLGNELGSQLGDKLGERIGKSLAPSLAEGATDSMIAENEAIVKAFGETGAAAGAAVAGPILGALVGAAFNSGQVIKEEIKLSVVDGFAEAEKIITTTGIFSNKQSIEAVAAIDVEIINNTIVKSFDDISEAIDVFGGSLEDFSAEVTASNASDAVTELTNKFADGTFSSLQRFQVLGEETIDTFKRLASDFNDAETAIKSVVGTGLEFSLDQYIQDVASTIETETQDAIDDIRDRLAQAQGDLASSEAFYARNYSSSDSMSDQTPGVTAAFNNFRRLRDTAIPALETELEEALSRVGDGLISAQIDFTQDLKTALGTDNLAGIFSDFNDALYTSSQTLQETITNQRDDLEALGFDRNTSTDALRSQFETASATGALSAESLANFVEAGVLLGSIADNTDALNTELETAANETSALQIELARANGDDGLATTIERMQRLADSGDPLNTSLLNQIFVAEDLAKVTDQHTQLQKDLNTALGDDAANIAIERAEKLADALDPLSVSMLNQTFAAQDLRDATEQQADFQKQLNTALGDEASNTAIDRAEEYARALSPLATEMLDAIYAAEDYTAALESNASALEVSSDLLASSTDKAFAVLTKALRNDIENLTEDYETNSETLRDTIDTVGDSISGLESVANSLKNAITNTVDQSTRVSRLQLQNARQQIAQLAAAGTLPDAGTLESLLGQVTGDTAQYYESAEDYYRDQGRTANDIAALSELANTQLTDAQQLQKTSESSLEALQDTYEIDRDILEGQIDYYQDQLDLSRNIAEATMNSDTAIAGFLSSLSTEEQGTSGFSAETIQSTAQEVAQNTINAGGTEDDAYRAIGELAINQGVSSAELGRALGIPQSEITAIAQRVGLPAFANGTDNAPGGLSLVGERGPELVNIPSGASVTPANKTANMMDNSELLAKLEELIDKQRVMATKADSLYNLLKPTFNKGGVVLTYETNDAAV